MNKFSKIQFLLSDIERLNCIINRCLNHQRHQISTTDTVKISVVDSMGRDCGSIHLSTPDSDEIIKYLINLRDKYKQELLSISSSVTSEDIEKL